MDFATVTKGITELTAAIHHAQETIAITMQNTSSCASTVVMLAISTPTQICTLEAHINFRVLVRHRPRAMVRLHVQTCIHFDENLTN